jgi:phosphate-selective porin OprO/OprP
MGYYPRQRIYLNLGAYSDALSESEKFATADQVVTTRLAWMPILSEEQGQVLEVAVMGRNSKPDGGYSREKSKPGVYLAPNFLDTGKFPADRSRTVGFEANYRKGPLLLATEYDWQTDHATSGAEPTFHGGEATIVWIATGETRPFNVRGAYFDNVSPRRSVFEGGPGALEAILGYTYNDFDDAGFQGGKFWRLTPMVIWHLSDLLHVHAAYGYGVLDRFGVTGATQFFQLRFLAYY